MKKRPLKNRILGILMLAVFCIGGVELAVCRFADPALYEKITAPVRRAASIAWNTGKAAVQDAAGAVSARIAEVKAESEESQVASDPAIWQKIVYADPAITTLSQRESGAVLTGGCVEVVYFNQCDDTWSAQPYGRDNIGGYGCGPTAMAMAVSSLTEQHIDPAQMAAWAYQNGYWASHGGSYLSLVQGSAKAYGLTAAPYTVQEVDALRQELASGKLFVALMGPGHFTSSGHFILLRGATLDGSILVADPSSLDRSLTTWDPEVILGELSGSRRDGAPLWELTADPAE